MHVCVCIDIYVRVSGNLKDHEWNLQLLLYLTESQLWDSHTLWVYVLPENGTIPSILGNGIGSLSSNSNLNIFDHTSYIYARVYQCIHIDKYIHAYIPITHLHIYIHTHTHTLIYIYVYKHTHIHVYSVFECFQLYIYIYIYMIFDNIHLSPFIENYFRQLPLHWFPVKMKAANML